MAKTRQPLPLDDLTEGDLVEVRCHDGMRYIGYYRGLKRWPLTKLWSVVLFNADDMLFYVGSREVTERRILKPVCRSAAD